MQYKLFFDPGDRRETRVGRKVYEADSIESVPYEVIEDIIDDVRARSPNFEVHYTRRWEDADGAIWFDYGSHTRFYILRASTPKTQ